MERKDAIRKLMAIRDIADRQNTCLVNGRLSEALTLQQERESIAFEIESVNMRFSKDDAAISDIVCSIKSIDEIISLFVNEKLAGVSKNLRKLKEAEPVIAAYNNELKLV